MTYFIYTLSHILFNVSIVYFVVVICYTSSCIVHVCNVSINKYIILRYQVLYYIVLYSMGSNAYSHICISLYCYVPTHQLLLFHIYNLYSQSSVFLIHKILNMLINTIIDNVDLNETNSLVHLLDGVEKYDIDE